MRRILALTGMVPILLATLAGVATADRTVPPPGNDYFTSAQLSRGLLTPAKMPDGYTASGGSAGSQYNPLVYGSNVCGGYASEVWGSVTYASKRFVNKDGSTVDVSITALGSAKAAEVVGYLAAAPRKCPSLTGVGETTKQTRLTLPDLGVTSAGLITVNQVGSVSRRRHAVAVAYGNASAVFEENGATAGTQARFLKIVKAGVKALKKINDPTPAAQLKRGLIELADLPKGHRVVTDGTVSGGDWFTEYDCSGKLVRYGPRGTAVERSFAPDKGAATIRMAVGSIESTGIVDAIRKRLSECPAVTDQSGIRRTSTYFSAPATDITVVAIKYQDKPAVARAVIVYRDWYADVRVTMTAGTTTEQVDAIFTAAVTRIFAVNT
ncbi:hypothetical protein AB0M02_44840 [Actinoplanes sp. NPDC051861]|uniref:hypothetical protein n=1 Tax=Actinoplanes sp. NPDC051861 TaxID=3155170 RepID=UPI0034128116